MKNVIAKGRLGQIIKAAVPWGILFAQLLAIVMAGRLWSSMQVISRDLQWLKAARPKISQYDNKAPEEVQRSDMPWAIGGEGTDKEDLVRFIYESLPSTRVNHLTHHTSITFNRDGKFIKAELDDQILRTIAREQSLIIVLMCVALGSTMMWIYLVWCRRKNDTAVATD